MDRQFHQWSHAEGPCWWSVLYVVSSLLWRPTGQCTWTDPVPRRRARHAGRRDVGVRSYADDTQLFLFTRAENSAATFTRLQICIDDVGEWMSANKLKLNTGKTQFTCLGMRQQLAKVDATTLSANGSTVDLLCNVTCLGVTIDQELSFADYVRRLSGQFLLTKADSCDPTYSDN